jgi:glutamate N-acetyltransferase/amino-acid N-acetyltransferase
VLVVNSGNANAFTGKTGAQAVKLTAEIAARAAGCKPAQVFLASTGVIGEPLDASKFEGILEKCEARPRRTLGRRARAIMTHRHLPEGRGPGPRRSAASRSRSTAWPGRRHDRPDMATMLSFVFTDAPIAGRPSCRRSSQGAGPQLQLRDGRRPTPRPPTPCSCSSPRRPRRAGRAPRSPLRATAPEGGSAPPLDDLLIDLAQQVARDGEGARKS